MFPVEPISAKMLDYYVGRNELRPCGYISRKDPGAVLRPGRGKPSGGKSAGKKWL